MLLRMFCALALLAGLAAAAPVDPLPAAVQTARAEAKAGKKRLLEIARAPRRMGWKHAERLRACLLNTGTRTTLAPEMARTLSFHGPNVKMSYSKGVPIFMKRFPVLITVTDDEKRKKFKDFAQASIAQDKRQTDFLLYDFLGARPSNRRDA